MATSLVFQPMKTGEGVERKPLSQRCSRLESHIIRARGLQNKRRDTGAPPCPTVHVHRVTLSSSPEFAQLSYPATSREQDSCRRGRHLEYSNHAVLWFRDPWVTMYIELITRLQSYVGQIVVSPSRGGIFAIVLLHRPPAQYQWLKNRSDGLCPP